VKRRDYMDYHCYQMVDDTASEYIFSYKSEVVRSYWLTKYTFSYFILSHPVIIFEITVIYNYNI
jgi:hypothetical protein